MTEAKMKVLTPGLDDPLGEEQDAQAQLPPFSFHEPEIETEEQQEFLDILTSGTIWEDGTKLVFGIVAGRDKKVLPPEEVHGGAIDPLSDYWQYKYQDGRTLCEHMFCHHLYHKDPVVFRAGEEGEQGFGYFRLSVYSAMARGPRRWGMATFFVPETEGPEEDHYFQSLERFKGYGWNLWQFKEKYPSQLMLPGGMKRLVWFFVAPEPIDNQKFNYRVEHGLMKGMRKRLLSTQPSRAEETSTEPLPFFANPLMQAEVEFKKLF